jgi:hypothetical protein
LQKQSDIGHALKYIVGIDGVRGNGFLPFPLTLLWCINSLLYQTSFGGQAKQGSGFSRQQINPNLYSFYGLDLWSAFGLMNGKFEYLFLNV